MDSRAPLLRNLFRARSVAALVPANGAMTYQSEMSAVYLIATLYRLIQEGMKKPALTGSGGLFRATAPFKRRGSNE
jgi:hypothetical protein